MRCHARRGMLDVFRYGSTFSQYSLCAQVIMTAFVLTMPTPDRSERSVSRWWQAARYSGSWLVKTLTQIFVKKKSPQNIDQTEWNVLIRSIVDRQWAVGTGPVLWICAGRNKTFPPSSSLPGMGEITGVNTASLGRYLHSSKTRVRWT